MNISYYLTVVYLKFKRFIYCLFFLLIQKPLYIISYNNKQNSFKCKGILYNSSIKLSGCGNVIIIEKGVRMNNVHIMVRGKNNKLIIHRNVIFHEGGRVKLEDENNIIRIGERSDFVDCFFAVSDYNSKIEVGEDCMFSAKIIIRNSDVHSITNNENIRINHAKDTIIGNRVWVGYGATILKGSNINDDCVIGTQSVVTGINVPQGSIVAGNPSKIIKNNIHWCRERLK